MSNDVTAGYTIINPERLRGPMQKVTDYMLKCMGAKPSADIVALPYQTLMTKSGTSSNA